MSRRASTPACTGTTLVARTVAEGWSGLAAMSGIPGLTGATPIQNVGAYGSEVADVIAGLQVYDRETGAVEEWDPQRCGFGFRTSAFKYSDRYVVLRVDFDLARSDRRAAGALPGARPAPRRRAGRRRAVDATCATWCSSCARSKGMVLDAADHDTWSVGSFFVNPFVAPGTGPGRLPALAGRRPDQAVGRLADRERRIRQGLRR